MKSVQIVDIQTKPERRCFEDVADLFALALRKLGHEVAREAVRGARPILFGLSDAPDHPLPPNAIIYNAEQVLTGKFWKRLSRVRNPIWDFSKTHVEWFRARGVQAVHVPFGYLEGAREIPKLASEEEDIDVLFYGWLNERRKRVLDELEQAGLHVRNLFGLYGEDRDRVIARSKVVLNLHYYEGAVLEMVRLSHLLQSGRCVVTESGGADPDLEAFATGAMTCAPVDGIVEACYQLVGDAARREEASKRGMEAYRNTDFVKAVENALNPP